MVHVTGGVHPHLDHVPSSIDVLAVFLVTQDGAQSDAQASLSEESFRRHIGCGPIALHPHNAVDYEISMILQ